MLVGRSGSSSSMSSVCSLSRYKNGALLESGRSLDDLHGSSLGGSRSGWTFFRTKGLPSGCDVKSYPLDRW